MKYFSLVLLLCASILTQAQTTLTHNVGTNLIQTSMYTCGGGNIEWARAFNLDDFGISTNDEFVITLGQVGFSEVGVWDVNITFNIYEIDNDFPASFSRDNLLGSSKTIRIYQSGFQLVTLEFLTPVVVPSHVERILVEVRQESTTSSAITFIAGTALDNDYSWFNGCGTGSYKTTEEIERPDARFYINVTGEILLSVSEEEKIKLKIYPNPVKNELQIDALESPLDTIVIYSMQGQVVLETAVVNSVNVSHLSPGVYFIQITSDEKVVTKKFIKE